MTKIILSLFLTLPIIFFGQDIDFTDGSSLLPSGTVSDHAVAITDMNGDGKDDIIRMDASGNTQMIYVAAQEEPGMDFSEFEVGEMEVSGGGSADAWGVMVADVDENGRNDVISGGYYNGVYIFKSNADNSSYTPDIELFDEIYVQGMSASDINNDGAIDLFICDDIEISQILTNDGAGNMSETASGLVPDSDLDSDGSGNYGSCFVDVDNNGFTDLYIAKCRQGVNNPNDPRRINLLYMNNGDGTWSSEGEDRGVALGAQSWAADFGDMDNDGDFDLFVGNHDVFSEFYLNDGNGYFTQATGSADLNSDFAYLVIQTTWADFNNDGFIDLLAMGNDNHTLALNDGDGTFTTHEDFFPTFPENSYALGDLNDDGFIDLYITANGYGGWGNEMWEDRIYLNTGNDNNFFKVSLTGVESNLNGIGARVSIYGPWGVQIREVKAGESYGIQHSLTQHFGLGANESIDQVSIEWPSGEVDNFYDVAANQQLEVVEGNGVSSVDEEVDLADVSLFPNPAEDQITLTIGRYTEYQGQDLELRIYDLHGSVIRLEKVYSDTERIDISALSGGVYTYSLTADKKLLSVREFIKR